MAINKYCNLYGQNKIKDEYTKINNGFELVQNDINPLLNSETTREVAETQREVNEANRVLRYENTKHYGAYHSEFTYHRNNIVSYGGSSFMLVVDESLGNAPPEYPATYNAYWALVGQKGDTGETGAVPNITVGTVTTLQPGNPATVTRQAGSPDTDPVFDFAIPKGVDGTGAGDMTKETYDTNNNGVVDDAEKLGGQLPAYYATSAGLNAHKLETAYYEQYKITANQLIPNNTSTNIFFTSRIVPAGLTDSGFAKININGQIEILYEGVYDLQLRNLAFEANADGERLISDAGGTGYGLKPTALAVCGLNSTVTAKVTAGYVLPISVLQNSGTNLNITAADVRISKR